MRRREEGHEDAVEIAEELNDVRGQGIDLGQLGALALIEGKLDEARTRQHAALRLFQQIHDPDLEAAACHQLGRIYHEQRQGDEAERHYREAARISEVRGNLAAAANTWSQLAALAREAGTPETAEEWYRKALDVDRLIGNPTPLGHCLHDLADLLQNQPGRLAEARQLAEEALAVAQRFGPPQRTSGSTTARSPASSMKRLERPQTANGRPRSNCRHATIVSCSGRRRQFSPRSRNSVSRRATAGP
jgi:tetratricopeptide (TPR) repeat protein